MSISTKVNILFSILILFQLKLIAQNDLVIDLNLDWQAQTNVYTNDDKSTSKLPYFQGAMIADVEGQGIPFYQYYIPLKELRSIEAKIVAPVFKDAPFDLKINNLSADIDIITTVEADRNNYIAKVAFIPIIIENGKLRILQSGQLEIKQGKAKQEPLYRSPPLTFNSVLENGEIIKIAVEETGLTKITYQFLKENLDTDIDNIDPRNIKLYGNGAGMLPGIVGVDRPDDLIENSIQIIGSDDGSFDNNDYILFYGEGASATVVDMAERKLHIPMNVYDTRNYYFLKIDASNGKRVGKKNALPTTSFTSQGFNDIIQLEEDRFNILHDFALGQGSGNQWFWEKFEVLREQNYNFSFPNLITTDPVHCHVIFAGRSENNSRFNVEVGGQNYQSNAISSVNTGKVETTHADNVEIEESFFLSGENNSIKIVYPENGAASTGWLDFIELNARRGLIMTGDQMIFRDLESVGQASTLFKLQNVNANTKVWDISQVNNVSELIANVSGSDLAFGIETTELKTFVAFDTNGNFPEVSFVQKIENQNIHGLTDADMVIIFPKDFTSQVERLAEHRRTHNGLKVEIVSIDQIYNEFSSGKTDPTALRDFAKMLFDRDPKFKYMLLFGDGSFDQRRLYADIQTKSDFIPVFQTESLNPIYSFPSDDFFGLLSDGEGSNLKGAIELAIGRIPVKTTSEAQVMVNKLINYDLDSKTFGDWRNKIVFIADDEDDNTHIDDADGIAVTVEDEHPQFNQNKIYLDAYQQISTPGGEKYPNVVDAINESMFKGALILNYLGHGGSKGLAQERILGLQDISSWSNKENLPLFVTATCSFTGFDNPVFVTAGERTYLSAAGGAIGLLTTTRAVFANSNERLTRAVFEQIFEREADGSIIPVGDVLRMSKNITSNGSFESNSRKFMMIGDPSMKLAIPYHKVATTSINGNPVSATPDTIRALQKVTISGEVTDQNGQLLSNFNGKVFPTIYDKVINVSTLANDSDSQVTQFRSQQNVIFKGAASVTNGIFTFTFVVPKDINYSFGNGKISYYATDEISQDAGGLYTEFIIGGTDPNAANDDQGPLVEVFMNDDNFVFGGRTTENPILYVKLSDDNGINVAGTSIGHDLTGILDEDSQNSYLLNDFYEAELDDYTKGTVQYPLSNLESGRHQIKVTAWDVANNSSEGFTEFVVAKSSSVALKHVLNYPNPFTTSTKFMFEHNLNGQLLDIQVRIFTVSGKLVKTIDAELLADGNRISDVPWDGKDDFGGDLAKGVYLYKVKVAPSDSQLGVDASESDFEKLVILK